MNFFHTLVFGTHSVLCCCLVSLLWILFIGERWDLLVILGEQISPYGEVTCFVDLVPRVSKEALLLVHEFLELWLAILVVLGRRRNLEFFSVVEELSLSVAEVVTFFEILIYFIVPMINETHICPTHFEWPEALFPSYCYRWNTVSHGIWGLVVLTDKTFEVLSELNNYEL